MMHRTVLIIGGGPAGSAAAITLARGGQVPRLIERRSGPHSVVCGGFLGWSGIAALKRLDVDPWRLGAQPITRFRFVARDQVAEAELPGVAAGISRQTLDSALIDAAVATGASVSMSETVRMADPDTLKVRLNDEMEIKADAIFLGTGKYELRGMNRRFARSSVGLRASLPAHAMRSKALAGVIEMHLFDQGYAGLLLQEDGAANLCLSIASERLSHAGNIPALVERLMNEAPLLAQRLDGKIPSHFDAVAGVPYGWRARDGRTGIFRIGDQGAVTASLAGDGIAIAIASGMSAARAFLNGGPEAAVSWQRSFHRQCRRPIGLAEALRHGAASPTLRSVMMTALHWMPKLGTRAAALTRFSPDWFGGWPDRAAAPHRGGRRSGG